MALPQARVRLRMSVCVCICVPDVGSICMCEDLHVEFQMHDVPFPLTRVGWASDAF